MNHSYCIGIIDFLQKYNASKKLERAAKSIISVASILSVQNPSDYASRFLNKFDTIVINCN